MTSHTHHNNPTPDDPNLTAYALGELDPASDVYKQIEARLQTDADAQAFVQQTRALGEQLVASYHADASSAGLAEHQHRELSNMIDQQPNSTNTPPRTAATQQPDRHVLRMPRKLLLAAGLGLAATAAIITITWPGDNTDVTINEKADKPAAKVTGLANVTHTLNEPVAADFDNATLAEVLVYLEKQTGIAFETNWSALKPRGISRDTRVSFSADQPQPARNVLTYALQLAWAQSPHPDPAEWAINDAGITIAPRSALAQARLDATAKLLENRRFSQAPVEASMLRTAKAKVWDSSLWNDILSKRAEAGQRIIEEANASLIAAEAAASKDDLDAANDHGVYAYQLLAMNATLLMPEQFDAPMQRIGKLQETLATKQAEQDKAAIVKAVQDAKANDKPVSDYDSAMLAAIEAFDNGSFDAAQDAVMQARTSLTATPDQYEPGDYNDRLARSARLFNQALQARWQMQSKQIAEAEARYKKQAEQGTPDEKQKAELVQNRLQTARALQQEQRYREAIAQLDAAAELDPKNAVIAGYRDLIQDTSLAVESVALRRERELSEASLKLINIEASTPYTDTLNYPGEWPDITAGRLGDTRGQAGGWTGSVAWGAGYADYNGKDAVYKTKYNNVRLGLQAGDKGADEQQAFYSQTVLAERNSNGAIAGKPTDASVRYAYDAAPRPQAAGSPRPVILLERKLAEPSRPSADPASGIIYSEREEDFADLGLQRTDHRVVLKRPNTERPRKEQLEAVLEGLDKNAIDGEPLPADQQELRQAQIDAIKRSLTRVAVIEKHEQDRIEAVNALRELERRFIQEQHDELIIEPQMNRDAYAMVNDNPFYNPADHADNGQDRAISTFSVDVDTAAYSLVRRQLMQQGQLPVPGAVRIEEMINYFDYDYDAPVVDGRALKDGIVTQASLEQFEKENEDFAPFATHIQVVDCPWQKGHQLVRIGIKGMEVAQDERPSAHLTFLIDVSGSMSSANKLPLVKQSLTMLLDKLNEDDRVSIVVYAGNTRTVLENASAADKDKIADALNSLQSGGSTAGAAGIQLAYDAAQKHFIDGGVNRVILCTDGDFNVGISDTDDLVALIKDKANPKAGEDGKRRGVYLSVMAYGMGNLNDAMMEPLTNAGNGNYAYIDTLEEATKVMYDQAGSTLVTIAKDVKVQVHFDPTQVMAYRLIGYENRVLANEDFDNDKVDAGDIGAGHTVTAIYEIVPFGADQQIEDNEDIRVVKQQIEALDEAIALNDSLMQTCSLTAEQQTKLLGSTKMLEQERVLCEAVVDRFEGKRLPAKPIDKPAVDAEPDVIIGGDGDAKPAKPVLGPELDKFEDGAMLAVKLRYKPVDAPAEDGTSRKIESRVFAHELIRFEVADENTRFAAAVASYGMQLRSSPHAGKVDLNWVIDTAEAASLHDPGNLRSEFVKLVTKTIQLLPAEQPQVEPVEDVAIPR